MGLLSIPVLAAELASQLQSSQEPGTFEERLQRALIVPRPDDTLWTVTRKDGLLRLALKAGRLSPVHRTSVGVVVFWGVFYLAWIGMTFASLPLADARRVILWFVPGLSYVALLSISVSLDIWQKTCARSLEIGPQEWKFKKGHARWRLPFPRSEWSGPTETPPLGSLEPPATPSKLRASLHACAPGLDVMCGVELTGMGTERERSGRVQLWAPMDLKRNNEVAWLVQVVNQHSEALSLGTLLLDDAMDVKVNLC